MKRAASVFLVGAVVFLAGFLGGRITTPEDLTATFAPPPPTPITAAVERRTISQIVAGRGVVTFDAVWTPAVGELPALDDSQARLTWIPPVGSEVQTGDALIEVSYRPIILLPGSRPLVRNLQSGDSGPDVTQLEESFAELGYLDANEVDNTYTTATGTALADLYAAAGYEPKKVRGAIIAPASELFVTLKNSGVVRELVASVGDPIVPGPLPLTLTIGPPVMIMGLPGFEASLLLGGEKVEILDETNGEVVTAAVTRIGSLPDETIGGVPVTIELDTELDDDRDYRVTIILETTGAPVLAVPEPAIFLDSDNASYLTLITEAGRQRVPIDIGLVGSDGWVEVIPALGSLAEGDQVLVGEG